MSDARKMSGRTPREARHHVLLGARISGFGGSAPTLHRVRDLSTRGARVDNASALRVGSTVLVSVGVLEEVGATVVWVKNDIAGLRFAEVIDSNAARSKTIIAPSSRPEAGSDKPKREADGVAPAGAGWIAGLDSPYRR